MTLAAAAGLVAGGAFTTYTTVYADEYNVSILYFMIAYHCLSDFHLLR